MEQEFKGQLQGFPPEVVEKMLERQVEQGNKRDVSVFEGWSCQSKDNGGFRWSDTIEGSNFWMQVIDKKDFRLFFREYPKSNNPFGRGLIIGKYAGTVCFGMPNTTDHTI